MVVQLYPGGNLMRHLTRCLVGRVAYLALLGALSCAIPAVAGDKDRHHALEFERISTFVVCENTSCDRDVVEETVAEITAVTTDGRTLIYTDSPQESIGFVDITDPHKPKGLGTVKLEGEPTSVSIAGRYALVGVNTSASFVSPSGHVAVFDAAACVASIAGCSPIVKLDVQGQPDSVAVSPDGHYAAVAVENERDEDITVDGMEGGLPQLPAGHLAIIGLKGKPQDWTVRLVELTGLADYAPEDPEPEYVAINRDNIAAVTLQENNHIALVHLPSGEVIHNFPAGGVTLENVDTTDNSLVEFNCTIENVAREPDAIAWLDNERLVTANEGDLFGGSRGFSIFDSQGRVLFDSGNSFEYLAVRHGHYPEARADAKGTEPEGVAAARYGPDNFIFVGSERAGFVAVYLDSGKRPEFVQILPTGIAPEGLLPIPGRNLFVASTENDEDWRAQINIFALKRGEADYPQVVSGSQKSGPVAGQAPIAWGALSALAPDLEDKHVLYTVHDNFYVQSRIYRLDVSNQPAAITDEIVLKKDGATVNYDLEGIATRAGGGFWLASEGAGTSTTRNLLIEAAADGTVLREVRLPPEVDALQRSNGFEGVAVTGSGASEKVYVAFQREWVGDPSGKVRIGEYTPATDSWRFFYYPLDAVESPAGGFVGLSELVSLGNGRFATIERDNQGGRDARIKKVYVFSIAGLTPQLQGGVFPVVTKYEALDLLPELQSFNGWVLDKPEGLAVAADGGVYVVTDNDGVDGASGETRLLRLGKSLH
jgi:DNA-binding beta-propeller fold protein YncE